MLWRIPLSIGMEEMLVPQEQLWVLPQRVCLLEVQDLSQ